MTTFATINDSYPGATPAGTEVEVIGPGHNQFNVEVRVPGSRKSLFPSPRWLDFPEPVKPVLAYRPLKRTRGML